MATPDPGLSAEAWTAIIAGLAVLLDMVFHIIGGVWLLARSRTSLVENLTGQLQVHRKEVDGEFENFRREIAETFTALRTAIGDIGKDVSRVELEAYKSFIKRDSFYEVMNRQQDVVAARLDKVDTKIDKLDETIKQLLLKDG